MSKLSGLRLLQPLYFWVLERAASSALKSTRRAAERLLFYPAHGDVGENLAYEKYGASGVNDVQDTRPRESRVYELGATLSRRSAEAWRKTRLLELENLIAEAAAADFDAVTQAGHTVARQAARSQTLLGCADLELHASTGRVAVAEKSYESILTEQKMALQKTGGDGNGKK